MKLSKLMLVALCGLILVGCNYDSFEDERVLGGLEFADPFVRIFTGGAAGTTDVVVGEANTSAAIAIESLQVDGNDATVTFNLGGTAEYGTIYTIEGATASGGTLVIPFQEDEEITSLAQADINLMFLVDTLENGPQTIELELASATSSNGQGLNVGQGDLRKNLTINLVND